LASLRIEIDAIFKNIQNLKMSIYKVVAFILVFIIITSSISGVLLVGLGGGDPIDKNSNSNSSVNQKIQLDFETLELATTDQEKQIGYMNRESICTKCGMLFIFDNEQPLSFWMKNTLVPLRITFIDKEGRVLNTALGQPKVTSPTVNSISPAKYVLEVPVDSQVDLKAGQVIDIQEMISKGVAHTTVANKVSVNQNLNF
jgi:uncharacterized membrane protein (UPF0127 family)